MAKSPLKLEQILPNEWRFVYRAKEGKLIPRIMEGVGLIEQGQFAQAEETMRAIIQAYPAHIDARNFLANLLLFKNEKAAALAIWREAAALGWSAFPANFLPGRDRLEWIWPENRAFLRASAGLALALFNDGKPEEAAGIFGELLKLDPRDHQGVRGIAIETAFAIGNLAEVTRICEAYNEDFLVDTTYARPLAMIMQGKPDEAIPYLRTAISEYPLVTKELLKKRHHRPQSADPGYVAVGGADEAYEYWRRMGNYWKAANGALEMLKENSTKSK